MPGIFDVAIVGFGPVGATLAALLGQAGVSTLVVDRTDDIYPLPRAIGFDHEVMRVMQNLGLADAIAPHVVPYRPTEYRGADGAVIARYESLPPPHPQGWEPSFVFTQPPFERALRACVSGLPDVEVRLSTEVKGLAEADDHVALAIAGPDGLPQTLRARYAVGCDGGASLVRKVLGIRFESLDFDEPWLVVDVLVNPDRLHLLPDTIVQYCDPERPTTFVIGLGNHRRWEFMLLPGEVPEEMNREDVIWRLLGRWLTPADGTLWRAAPYVFHALVAERWRRGRVFLAGDSAHMTPPFMAQGMCQGIRDAANLAWKLPRILAGTAADTLLDTYEQERRPHVLATTRIAKALGRVICERDREAATARDVRMLAEAGDPPAVRYRQNLIPGMEEGALWSEQGAPVGTRFPQPKISTPGGPRLLDDVAGTGFRLVLSAAIEPAMLPGRLRHALERLGGCIICLGTGPLEAVDATPVITITEVDDVLDGWFRSHRIVATLVRPDHYVFGVVFEPSDLTRLASIVHERLLSDA